MLYQVRTSDKHLTTMNTQSAFYMNVINYMLEIGCIIDFCCFVITHLVRVNDFPLCLIFIKYPSPFPENVH